MLEHDFNINPETLYIHMVRRGVGSLPTSPSEGVKMLSGYIFFFN